MSFRYRHYKFSCSTSIVFVQILYGAISIGIISKVQADPIYTGADRTKKGMLTTNRKLIESTEIDRIHFNAKKLESVIGYHSDDKSGLKIWNLITDPTFVISNDVFPDNLSKFIDLNKLQVAKLPIVIQQNDELPLEA